MIAVSWDVLYSHQQEGPFDPHKLLNSAVSNVIAVMLFGKNYDYRDPDFVCLQEIINQNLQLGMNMNRNQATSHDPHNLSAQIQMGHV